jgi:integrase
MFKYPTSQAGNRLLVKIGNELNIGTKLTSKIGRKTCATIVVNESGDLHAAQKYLNHSDIRTTMRYDHVDEKRKEKASLVIENFLGELMRSRKAGDNQSGSKV